MDRHRSEVRRVLRETYGADQERKWWAYWRIFFLACAELWAWHGRPRVARHPPPLRETHLLTPGAAARGARDRCSRRGFRCSRATLLIDARGGRRQSPVPPGRAGRAQILAAVEYSPESRRDGQAQEVGSLSPAGRTGGGDHHGRRRRRPRTGPGNAVVEARTPTLDWLVANHPAHPGAGPRHRRRPAVRRRHGQQRGRPQRAGRRAASSTRAPSS